MCYWGINFHSSFLLLLLPPTLALQCSWWDDNKSSILTWLESVSLYQVMLGAGCDSTTHTRSIFWPIIPAFSPEMETCEGPSKKKRLNERDLKGHWFYWSTVLYLFSEVKFMSLYWWSKFSFYKTLSWIFNLHATSIFEVSSPEPSPFVTSHFIFMFNISRLTDPSTKELQYRNCFLFVSMLLGQDNLSRSIYFLHQSSFLWQTDFLPLSTYSRHLTQKQNIITPLMK